LATSGIRFNDFFFSEPADLAGWAPPRCAGLFSVLINDANWAPKPFQPLYFGELGNNTPLSEVLQDCSRIAAIAKGKALLVSVLPMPFSTTQQRLALRHELISAYNPCYQTDIGKSSARDLELKLADLQKKHEEQTAQMTQIMAGVNAQAPPRRRIGFL
jgi:hypothetical protein